MQRLVDAKRAGRAHRACDRLAQAAPASAELLQRARAASGEPPPVALVLPEHVAKRDAPVRTHDLRSYDRQPDPQPDHPEDPPESPDE